MDWRTSRQLFVVFILFLMAGGIGFVILYPKLFPAPTCSDGKQNQGELGVDCGGPCAPCELQNPIKLNPIWARAVKVKDGVYAAVALVQNLNESLGAGSFRYRFRLQDDLGEIAKIEGEAFSFPQERFYVVEPRIDVLRDPALVEFEILDVKWELSGESPPNVIVEKKSYKTVIEQRVRRGLVEASLRNLEPFGFRKFSVNAVLLDAQGNVIGANKISVDGLPAYSQKLITFLWPEPITGVIEEIQIEPRINLFDSTVIMRPN